MECGGALVVCAARTAHFYAESYAHVAAKYRKPAQSLNPEGHFGQEVS